MATDQMSLVFSALADPTRRAILARLASEELPVGELAEPFDMTLPAVSNHLRVLERAGLIRREVEAQRRRCSLTPRGLDQAAAFIEEVRQFWDEKFGRLDSYLASLQSGSGRKKKGDDT